VVESPRSRRRRSCADPWRLPSKPSASRRRCAPRPRVLPGAGGGPAPFRRRLGRRGAGGRGHARRLGGEPRLAAHPSVSAGVARSCARRWSRALGGAGRGRSSVMPILRARLARRSKAVGRGPTTVACARRETSGRAGAWRSALRAERRVSGLCRKITTGDPSISTRWRRKSARRRSGDGEDPWRTTIRRSSPLGTEASARAAGSDCQCGTRPGRGGPSAGDCLGSCADGRLGQGRGCDIESAG
jgi:hypothetical protein